MLTIEIRAPYLIFLGHEKEITYAKTGAGMVQWRPELCEGQISLAKDGLDLELKNMTPLEAKEAGIKSLIIGTAAIGGGIPEPWLDLFEEVAALGIDIVGGVHNKLCDEPRLAAAANKSGARLVDVRIPPNNIPVGTGKKRSGKRILMVGTDCAVGKKYSALALERDMKNLGMSTDFRASGQTGIMIAGRGIPIDAVVSDFVSGAAELLSPANEEDHWDVIEGQGGIFHPGYSAVSMGLLVGSQPDYFIVCHEAERKFIEGWEGFKLPNISEVIERTIAIGSLTNPSIKCAGVCINTMKLDEGERESYLVRKSAEIGLPCVDPLIDGTAEIIKNLKDSQ